ncbi:MAG: hypothetical protein IT374_03355 [Polyangiaceae bacterium]|nr:hypothetical protein [Polyangiaceae bacterium]
MGARTGYALALEMAIAAMTPADAVDPLTATTSAATPASPARRRPLEVQLPSCRGAGGTATLAQEYDSGSANTVGEGRRDTLSSSVALAALLPRSALAPPASLSTRRWRRPP